MEGDRSEGQAAIFKKSVGEGKERAVALTCFKCGKVGHKAIDCWQGKGSSQSKVVPAGGSSGYKITCFTCGEEGHKSPQCPRNNKGEKPGGKDVKPKPVKRVWHSQPGCAQVEGVVNGHVTMVLLDSGADITLVPESLVDPNQRTGRTVAVKPFGAQKPLLLPTADIPFKIGELEWVEGVGVVPKEEGAEEEVLYSLDLRSQRGLDLVVLMNKVDPKTVLRVTTRAQSKADRQEEEKEMAEIARDRPKAKPLVPSGQDVIDEPGEGVEVEVVKQDVLGRQDEECEKILVVEKDASVERKEEVYELRKENREEPELVVPLVKAGRGDRDTLVEETLVDPSLAKWREHAQQGVNGFVWESGLLYQEVTTHTLEKVLVMVVPKAFRNKILVVAHDKLNHMGARRLIRQRFIWPGMGQDIIQFCRSCPICQKCSKSPARKVPMVERSVLSEPFESMAFDIVGPMPKGKGGCIFLLTAICMATRWPEAIPLRSISAKSVAMGMLEIFWIPLLLVTDQGAQFVGSVMTTLCANLHIEKIKTTPYHPEGNGVVERMHGTLGAMLTKAASEGQDWVGQIPFALFALRAAPNKDTAFSPFELVYGRQIRTPLDIIHQGWAQLDFEELDTSEWAEWLVERLQHWHSIMKERGDKASKVRKKGFDRKCLDRKLEEGDMVLCRIPGMTAKLEESWRGPYPVVEKLNRVNYRVDVGKGRSKVLHLNNMKRYQVREAEVMRLVVVAEDFDEDDAVRIKMEGKCLDFDEEKLEKLKEEFVGVFTDSPGKTSVSKLLIHTGETPPISSMPYRVPDRLKEGVREEVTKLVDMGVVIESTSPWASPIVPVPKTDGTLRLCIDYRKINSVTEADPYYMVTLDEILERVGGSGCISKLDLSKGFYQIVVDSESVDKTAFVTPFGKYAFTRMPFGLRNAPAIFQRVMEIVLRGCYEFSAPYIDDIVIFSKNGVEHIVHLKEVLVALQKNGLTAKLDKCEFGMKRLEYLGHLIGSGEVAVPSHRATAMAEFIQPRTKKQLRAFLGAASYYRRFICNFANYSSLLSPDTSKYAPGVVVWSVEKLEAFHKLKVSLVDVCVLTVPSSEDCFVLHTDASGAGIGATLNVLRDGEEKPVAFYSKQLQGAQKQYSATELEGLAIFKAIYFFSHFLWGRKFKVLTDHRALVSLLKSKTLNKRLHGWVM